MMTSTSTSGHGAREPGDDTVNGVLSSLAAALSRDAETRSSGERALARAQG